MAKSPNITETRQFNKLFVAAIDFGTAYSGFAYSSCSDYKTNPLKIFAPHWHAEDTTTEKTPTCVLFDKDKKFTAFGYEAQDKYAELAEEDDHIGWRYFKNFKMMLMPRKNKTLRKNAKLKDDQDQEMLALDVFSASIKFLKDELMKNLTRAIQSIRPTDVHWVLTVPAIWDDSAKQFMREAANMAGIDDAQLSLALEPEGAAIYCKEIAVDRVEKNDKSVSLSAFKPDSKFLLLDLGGGTVDITVEKVEANGTLTELYHPDGGPWGGNIVDQKYRDFLENLLGVDAMKNFYENNKSDELYMSRHFETLKKKIDRVPSEKGKQVIRIPRSLVECAGGPNEVNSKIKQSRFKDTVTLVKTKDKMWISDYDLQAMFTTSWSGISTRVKKLFFKRELQGITTIILVGGFSESPFIANEMKHAFPDKNVLVPQDARLAVLKGAVLFGHNPKSISSRKMAYTYGISTAVTFDESMHPPEKKVIRDGNEKCEDVFRVFFKIGQTVTPDKTIEKQSFNPAHTDDTSACVDIYRTKAKNPVFVTDTGCERVGTVNLTGINIEGGLVEVTFLAGDTELKVEARQQDTNNKISTKFQFIR